MSKLIYGLLLAYLTACSPAVVDLATVSPVTSTAADSTGIALEPTAQATTVTPPPSPTPPTTSTRRPSASPSATPSVTPSTSPSSTPTATATKPAAPAEAGIDRQCPEPAPLKPAYARYNIGVAPWPTPDPDLIRESFWLRHPFAGGDRLLINNGFPYGWDANGRLLLHNGIDMAEPLGTPVLALDDGQVVYAGPDEAALYGWRCDWYGHLVVLRLDREWGGQPIYALYGHVLNLVVETGDIVQRGDPVAEVGFGGAASHPHLHLEIRIGQNRFDATRNPVLWLPPGRGRGVIAGRLLDPEGRPWQGVGISIAGGPEGELLNSWSYLGDPAGLAQPDEGWAENFVFGDVRPGEYRLETRIQGITYSTTVTVEAGQVATVELVTEPYRIPTPAPPATPTATTDIPSEPTESPP